MANKPKYAAGLQFIVNTPESDRAPRKRDQKAIRSHAARAREKDRDGQQLQSWISPGRNIDSSKPPPLVGPLRVGSDFAALQLPPGIEPRMVQDLVKLIDLHSHGVYPYEICLKVHPAERGWFPHMMSDICCLHSMMFSVRAFVDRDPLAGIQSRLALFHYSQTLQLLQARINAFEQSSVISDTTIMAIITLASAAELTEEVAAARNHIDGLFKVVGLRGGLRRLDTQKNLQVKVCRADLGHALRYGHRPRLFREDIDWGCFIAGRGFIRCSHEPLAGEVDAFVNTLDTRLQNAWSDLHAFSCLSNLAYQTTRKLSAETYNEMVISILYRLAHLSFDGDVVQEAVRAALLAYSTTIFMQRQFMPEPYGHLSSLFRTALMKLRRSAKPVPESVALWLTVVFHIFARHEPSHDYWEGRWLEDAISLLGLDSWPQARDMLKTIMWVDFVHEQTGQRAFERAISLQ